MKITEFKMVKKLGEGQFGMVYLCVRRDTDTNTTEQFAIKVINKG